jgi:hypothetical protein
MDLSKIDATHDVMTAEELAEVHRYIDVWERAGYMTPAEAAAWRERIAVWRRCRRQGKPRPPKPVVNPLLDDPDPFLP